MFLTMPDIVDEAVWLTEAERDEGVRRIQSRLRSRPRASLTGDGAIDCAGCGETIGADRRAALPSATRCVACQSRVERGANGRAATPIVGGAGYPERTELGDNL
jgi:phage/conjugal plasmid C-4 type zinc finger TraR family protein